MSKLVRMITIFIAILAFSGCNPKAQALKEEMTVQKLLQEFSLDKIAQDDFEIQYQIGDEFAGMTSFTLLGTGAYKLSSSVTQGRALKAYEGDITPEEVKQIVKKISDEKIWETRHLRPIPGDGEPVPTFTFKGAGVVLGVNCWATELKENIGFSNIQDVFLDLIKRLSNNEVLETGR